MTAAINCTAVRVQLGDHLALDDVTWQVAGGSCCAIVGPNGAGKSTLLRVLLGLQAHSGDVRVLGHAPSAVPAGALGYVPQVKALDRTFPATALELVATGIGRAWPWRLGAAQREQAGAALERVGLADRSERNLAALSGGELQRVYLARCLVRQPQLILLDEPATGIDVGAQLDLYAILDRYRADAGGTIVMVTHDWGAAQHHSDHVLVLNRRVIASGAPDAVLTEGALAQAFGHIGHAHHMHPGPCDHD